MMTLFSVEFWLGVVLCINFLMVLSFWALVRKLQRGGIGAPDIAIQVNTISDKVHQSALERLEACTDNLADKAAVRMVDRAAQDIIDLLDPLVKGSESTAATFDVQIKEKQRLIRELNDALDSRIISINLLLSRAEAVLNDPCRSVTPTHQANQDHFYQPTSSQQSPMGARNINFSGLQSMSDFKERDSMLRQESRQSQMVGEEMLDQQQRILDLYENGLDADEIASKVGMPRGEVQLVIDLKEKFIKMESRLR